MLEQWVTDTRNHMVAALLISRKKGGSRMAYSYALNSVYNNYLTTYTPKSGRYDSHKKSELRGVYNSIVKLNKESPLSIIDSSVPSQSYAVNMKENARELRNTIASLGGLEEDGLLNKKTAYSSSPSVATVKYIGDVYSDEDASGFELTVEKLASSQINTGHFLENGPVDINPGTYSFDININNMSYEFQFNINEGETNLSLQQKLSRLINNSNIGLVSSVKEEANGSALELETKLTGIEDDKQYLFTVSDDNTSKLSGAVDYLGIDKISQLPDNAKFYLNDEPHESYSNHFTIAKTYEITLNEAQEIDDEPISIGIKADTESMAENIQQFADGYNSFINNTSSFLSIQPKTSHLLNEMNRISNAYGTDLKNLGISFDESGYMQVNREALSSSIDTDSTLEAISGMRKFTNLVLNKANQISINPMNYVDKTIVAYKNPGKELPTPYITSQYSGMMFNGYC